MSAPTKNYGSVKQAPNARRSRSRGSNNTKQRFQTPRNHTFESNGPEIKIRGSAQQVLEKYMTLAQDAFSRGDRIIAEGYFQHAEHYYRIVHAEAPAQSQPQQQDQPQAQDQPQQQDQPQAQDQNQPRHPREERADRPVRAPEPVEKAAEAVEAVAVEDTDAKLSEPREEAVKEEAAETSEEVAPRKVARPRRTTRPRKVVKPKETPETETASSDDAEEVEVKSETATAA